MWPNPQFSADLVTFTEEMLSGKLHFLCGDWGYEGLWILDIPGWKVYSVLLVVYRKNVTFYSEILRVDNGVNNIFC